MTALTTGRAGVNALLRRYLVWRVGWPWYLIALFGVPAGFLAVSSLALGRIPIQTIIEQWPKLLALLPLVLISGLMIGALGEELGWRGFALPRLQRRFGALWASLILGVLWAGWHVPLFTLAEWKGSIAVPTLAMAYFSWVVPVTVIITWIYNNVRGSLLIITLFHGALNATVGLVALGLLVIPDTLYFQAILYGVVALALIALTRGRLSYDGEEAARRLSERPAPEIARRGRRLGWVAVGAVVVLVSLWAIANVIYTLAGL
jgi:membrane protease YdiL (CAAX protease family)